MKWSASNKLYYFCLCENFVRQYDTAYYKYLPANLEVANYSLRLTGIIALVHAHKVISTFNFAEESQSKLEVEMFIRLLFLPNFLYFRKSVVKKLRV